MITVVDRANDRIIQKITKPDGKLIRYQVVDKAGDSNAVKVFSNLQPARAAIGKTNGGKLN